MVGHFEDLELGLEGTKSEGGCAIVKDIREVLIGMLAQIVLGDSVEYSSVRKVVEGFLYIMSKECSFRSVGTKDVMINLDERILCGEMGSKAEHIVGKGGVRFEVV